MKSFLETLQNTITADLQKRFNEVKVKSHREDNYEYCINEAIESSVGISVVVGTPMPVKIVENMPGFACEDISLRIKIIDNPCTNLEGPSALVLAEGISDFLNLYHPQIEGWHGCLALTQQPWKTVSDPEKMGRYIIEINFLISGSIPS